jgi:hypothetical protein
MQRAIELENGITGWITHCSSRLWTVTFNVSRSDYLTDPTRLMAINADTSQASPFSKARLCRNVRSISPQLSVLGSNERDPHQKPTTTFLYIGCDWIRGRVKELAWLSSRLSRFIVLLASIDKYIGPPV